MSRFSTAMDVPRRLSYHAYTIWLFTRSDIKTTIVPNTIFGLVGALESKSRGGNVSWEVLLRMPLVVLWLWMNLLAFNVDNQRQPSSILEDKLNKPWRAMPTGRISGPSAKVLVFILYPVSILASLWLGGVRHSLSLLVLGVLYNDMRLGDYSWVTRNIVNAAGFRCFAAGAMEVAMQCPLSAADHSTATRWLGVIAAVVFSSIQMQDMADQPGDRMRGRKTMPLSVGDAVTRWLSAIVMVVWSLICPLYWAVGLAPQFVVWAVGFSGAVRTLTVRTVEADARTFKLWNIWMACFYFLPLVATLGW
nr:(-)-alpha-bisabolol synthase [Stachybotrys sp.]